jgi:crossover junction endodeoxyribonuclease RusA
MNVPSCTWITVPIPPSANEYWVPARGRGLVPSKKAMAYKATVARVCLDAKLVPLLGDVMLRGEVYQGRDNRDLGNCLKVLEDALEGYAYLNDKQVRRYSDFGFAAETDPKNPRIELVLCGEAFGTLEDAAAWRLAKAQSSAKRRATRNRNRAAKKYARASLPVSAVIRPGKS